MSSVSTQPALTDEPIPFLDGLSASAVAELRSRGVTRTYPRGAALFRQGDTPDRVMFLLAGQVKVSYTTSEGKEVVFAFPAHGELVGELSAIDREPRSATVSVVEPVQALVLSVADFRRALEATPEIAMALLELFARRLRYANRQRVELGAYDSLGRVALRLVELAERFGEPTDSGVRITLPLSQEELAGWTGSSREAVSKALRVMRELGWIKTFRRSITVVDADALRRRAL